jgi:hypothetical protein
MSTEATPISSLQPHAFVVLPNEARTVENPILDWLQSEELGWRFEDSKAVAREYRLRRGDDTVDEREVLLCPASTTISLRIDSPFLLPSKGSLPH